MSFLVINKIIDSKLLSIKYIKYLILSHTVAFNERGHKPTVKLNFEKYYSHPCIVA